MGHTNTQKLFWEKAGCRGYGPTIFSSPEVQRHIRFMTWGAALKTAHRLGLDGRSRVLELGCGDGEFALSLLAANFLSVDGFDYAASAIEKARSLCGHRPVTFSLCDIAKLDYTAGQYWDGAFLMGFLHHVKDDAPAIIAKLAKVAPRVVVADPNGNNLVRKALELLPSYRRAGEQSFRLRQLTDMFVAAGYRLISRELVSAIPPFTPAVLLPAAAAAERIIEKAAFLENLKSTYVLGFQRA
jgi:SAM-dependent methyltransferase